MIYMLKVQNILGEGASQLGPHCIGNKNDLQECAMGCSQAAKDSYEHRTKAAQENPITRWHHLFPWVGTWLLLQLLV